MTVLEFSLCESVAASARSPWHVRPLEKNPAKKLGGGIDTDSLCTLVKAPSGWDLDVVFRDHIEGEYICKSCKDRYDDFLRFGELYFEHEGKKYARMRHIDGLEKQVLESTARVEWYTLQRPTLERPLFLLEFEMQRRLNANSERWFKPETFRVAVPKEKVSAAFLRALASPPPPARYNTGTSSALRESVSRRKTTSASRR